MGLLVYKFSDYRTIHEREQFRFLCNSLREYYGSRDEWCIFLANYNIYDTELDGLLIKQDAIMCVEFKKYGGEITAVDNGQWTTADGTVIKGGSGKTVYQQANINHVCVRKGMKAATSLSNKQLSDIAALVVFHRPITTLYNNLSEATQCWLHITDNNHFLEKVQDITTDKLFLEPQQMQKLIEELNLSEYYLMEEYSNPELLDMDFSEEEDELPAEENEGPFQPINEVKKFSRKEEPVASPSDASNFQEQPVVDLTKFTPTCREDVEIWTKSVFHTLNIDKFIEVYDTLIDSVPSWVVNEHGHRFVVVSFMFHDEIVAFEKFTHLRVKHHKSYNYWFCDSHNTIDESKPQNFIEQKNAVPIEPKDTETSSASCYTLPLWLEDTIFNALGAQYSPDHETFAMNLDSDEEKVKVYLGTYFPRSCAESYIIAKDLFQNPTFKEKFAKRAVLNVLDIACGTGGELIGLLLAAFEFFPQITHISIYAIDGNPHALKFFRKILTRARQEFAKKTITLTDATIPLRSKDDMRVLSEIVPGEFDFIFSNKSGSELLSIEDSSDNAYGIILDSFAPKLSINGLMIVLDVTSKNQNGIFCPIVLNSAFNNFTKLHTEYKSIIPIACGLHECKCTHPCYTQRIIMVSHCRKINDVSKVSYRILARNEFASAVLLGKADKQYIVTPDREERSVCPYTEGTVFLNAFKISQ